MGARWGGGGGGPLPHLPPSSGHTAQALPTPRFVQEDFHSYVALTVLFLTVQQFAENLRQSMHFKMRTWQYLAAALPDLQRGEDLQWDMLSNNSAWAPFFTRCRNVCALLKYLLTLVDKNTINYADVDDIFSRTTVTTPDPNAPQDVIPMYAPPTAPALQFAIPVRKLPPVRDYEYLLPGLKTEDGVAREIFQKTYGEQVVDVPPHAWAPPPVMCGGGRTIFLFCLP